MKTVKLKIVRELEFLHFDFVRKFPRSYIKDPKVDKLAEKKLKKYDRLSLFD